MKYKKLTKEQILISLDRLARFKNTKEKYLRVFSDLILSNLLEPKFKKSDLEKLSFSEIKNYATIIFNNSFEFDSSSDKYINRILMDYENSVFNLDDETQILLENELNYIEAIKFITDDNVVNLKWLKSLASKQDLLQARNEYSLKYPIEKVILVEGITEEILLPAFSKFLNKDFYKMGIQIIPAGGKNQVVKMYYNLSKELKIPIFLLLDKDAEDNIKQILPRLREIDKIHLVSCGEFEDLLPHSLIIKTVNAHFKNFLSIQEVDLNISIPMAKILEDIFKTQGLHEFKKAEFAKLVKNNISKEADVSSEIIEIIDELSNFNKNS